MSGCLYSQTPGITNLVDRTGFEPVTTRLWDDLLQEIRGIYRIPVILLTANDTETDVVMGLELGAADYITKPFSLAILRAKVNT